MQDTIHKPHLSSSRSICVNVRYQMKIMLSVRHTIQSYRVADAVNGLRGLFHIQLGSRNTAEDVSFSKVNKYLRGFEPCTYITFTRLSFVYTGRLSLARLPLLWSLFCGSLVYHHVGNGRQYSSPDGQKFQLRHQATYT